MRIQTFSSHKGGTGCTTVASSTALLLAKRGSSTLLVDAGISHDTYGWLSMMTPLIDSVIENACDNLDVVSINSVEEYMALDLSDYTHIVIDMGQRALDFTFDDTHNVIRTVVIRNDYLSLRNTVGNVTKYDKAVVIVEPNRALSVRDCKAVLSLEVTPIDLSMEWARSIDAGLTIHRVERFMGEALAPVMA